MTEPDALRARVASLEDERRRTFEEAQREADTMFAQYQLSQLLGLGDDLGTMTRAVLPSSFAHERRRGGRCGWRPGSSDARTRDASLTGR